MEKEWADMVVAEFQEIRGDIKLIKDRLYSINSRITRLETERNFASSIVGFFGGVVSTVVLKLFKVV